MLPVPCGEVSLWQVFIDNFSNVLVAVVGFFLVRTLNRLEASMDRLDKKVDNHEGRISYLEGARGIQR